MYPTMYQEQDYCILRINLNIAASYDNDIKALTSQCAYPVSVAPLTALSDDVEVFAGA